MNEETQLLIEKVKNEQNPFEKARLILLLKNDRQIPLHTISEKTSIKPSYMSHILRLLRLPALIVDGYSSQLISISHLFIISRLHNDNDMIEVYEKVLTDNLTSQKTEELIREKLYGLKTVGEYLTKGEIDTFIKSLNLKEKKAKIIQTRTKGKLVLEVEGNLIYTTKELQRLMHLLSAPTLEDTAV